ncbi:MAG TPA: PKD domain-containing protein, partial [Spirochaetia bacterium]|nr:PKD domain-containing protein [Spirochaetia bacterium]
MGKIYKKENTIFLSDPENTILSWIPSTDEHSGVKGYKAYLFYNENEDERIALDLSGEDTIITGNELSLKVLKIPLSLDTDGRKVFYMTALDNVDNESGAAEIVFFVDTKPPVPVENLAAGLSSTKDAEGMVTGQEVNLAWDTVTTDNPIYSPESLDKKSGVKGYEVAWRVTDNNAPEPTVFSNPRETAENTFSIPINNDNFPVRGRYYYFGVRSVDNVGNKSGWRSAKLYIPREPLLINVINYGKPRAEDGEPVYPVTIQFDQPPAYFFVEDGGYTPEYSIEGIRVLTPAGEKYYPVSNIVFTPIQTKLPWTVVNGNVALELTLTGKQYAHQTYEYEVRTVHRGGSVIERGNIMAADPVPNIPPEFLVEIRDMEGNLLGTVDRRGYTPETGSPLRLYTSLQEPLSITVVTESNDGKDAEGDRLFFKLKKKPEDETLGETTPVEPGNGAVPLSVTKSAVYHLYAAVDEYTDSIDGTLLPVGTFDQNYLPVVTLHDNMTEGFYIYFDFNEGEGVFALRERNGTVEYNVDNPTGTEAVDLYIEANRISDRTGPVESGIQAVYVWNVPVTTATELSGGLAELIVATEPSDGEKVNLGIETEAAEPGEEGARVPDEDLIRAWELDGVGTGEETFRIVAMKVLDRVGNERYFWKVVVVDKKPPAAPALNGFDHIYNGNRLSVTWDAGDGCALYDLSWPNADGSTHTAVTATPELTIDTAGYSLNTEIPITVTGRDKAGNRSSPVVYRPFTLPALGEITAVEDGYSPSAGHYIQWTIEGGQADGFVMQHLSGDGLVDAEKEFDLTGTCLWGGLEAHATYSFRLAAVNGGGDAVYGAPFTWTLSNNAPDVPDGLNPVGWTAGEVKLSWRPAFDVDGDEVVYDVVLMEEGVAYRVWNDVTGTECPEGSATLDLEDGKEYGFVVTADDGLGLTTASGEATFRVDASAPVIRFTSLPDPSAESADQHVVVEIRENLSGLEEAGYWTSKGDGSRDDMLPLTPTETAPGVYEASIPVTEGEYSITAAATDRVGNRSEKATGVLTNDRNPPEIRGAGIILGEAQDGYLGSTGTIPVTLSLSDDFSGVKGIRYGFTDTPGGAVSVWTTLILEPVQSAGESGVVKNYLVTLTASGADGAVTYPVLKAFDWAENESTERHMEPGILTDRSPPATIVEVTGFSSAYGQYYIHTIDQIEAATTVTEEDSRVTETAWAMAEAGTAETDLSWHPDFETAKEIGFTDGKSYRIYYRAVNSLGSVGTSVSPAFVYDGSAAVNLALSGHPEDPVVPGEEIRLSGGAEEPDSALTVFSLSIGTAESPVLLSGLLDGNEAGKLVLRGTGPAAFDFSIPQIPDGEYRIRYEVVNASGLSSVLADAGTIRVSGAAEKLVVTTAGSYSSLRDTLTASLLYHGPGTVTGFEYRIVNADGTGLSGWEAADGTVIRRSGLSLVNGATYRIEARALLEDGRSVAGTSLPVTVDYTPPEFDGDEGLVTPRFSTSRGLWVTYRASDPESNVARVGVLLEKKAEDGSRIDVGGGWIMLPPASEARLPLLSDGVGNPLALSTGDAVYLTVRAENRAGLASDAYAPLIVIDDTPPPVPRVIDQGRALNTSQYPSASWYWTEEDPESGSVLYEWALVESTAQSVNESWITDDGTREAGAESVREALGEDFTPTHMSVWYFLVRVTNGAGLVTYGASNGFIYDETAPLLARATLVKAGEELFYTQSFTDLGVRIEAADPETVIPLYNAVAGTWDANGEWTPLPDGTVYSATGPLVAVDSPPPDVEPGTVVVFRGACVNETGLVSEYGDTKGVIVYSELPSVTGINARMNGPLLYADWTVDSAVPPVTGYTVELRTLDTNQAVFTTTTTEKSLVTDAAAENIAAGRYRVYVKAKSATGPESAWKTGPAVVVDPTPPEIVTFETVPFASRTVTIESSTRDAESGIAEYAYRIGTFENPGLLTNGWRSVFSSGTEFNETVAFSDLAAGLEGIRDGSRLYVRLKVKNGVGLWSGEKLSAPIIIDRSPPSVPVVEVANPFTRFDNKIEGIAVRTADPESGITHCAYAVTPDTSPESLDEAFWFEVNVGENVFELDVRDQVAEGFLLGDADQVYVSVKARNGAGDWSGIGTGGVVTVDLSPPAVEFVVTDELLDEGIENGIVVNDTPHDISYEVTEQTEGKVAIELKLIDPNGIMTTTTLENEDAGLHSYGFDGTVYGRYELRALVRDAAGNASEECVLKVRLNAPTEITLRSVTTTPGRPLVLSPTVTDEDGDGPFTYHWLFGDGSEATVIDLETVTHPYYHREQYAQVSAYTVTLEVTDKYGKTTSVTAAVTVENTTRGRLYADEYWAGEHVILGDILVPETFTLTVAANTAVLAGRDEITGYNHRLTVEGRLVTEPGAEFDVAGEANAFWYGIVVRGRAVLENVTIRKARYGLRVQAGADVTLSGATFKENEIGIHAFT